MQDFTTTEIYQAFNRYIDSLPEGDRENDTLTLRAFLAELGA